MTPGSSSVASACTLPGGAAWAAGAAIAMLAAVNTTAIKDFILTRLRVTLTAMLRIRAMLCGMGIYYRKRKKTGKNSWINVSGSGASMSTKVGPVTFNSRGGMWVNLPGGLNFRGRWR